MDVGLKILLSLVLLVAAIIVLLKGVRAKKFIVLLIGVVLAVGSVLLLYA